MLLAWPVWGRPGMVDGREFISFRAWRCTLTFSLTFEWLPVACEAGERESLWHGRVGRIQEWLLTEKSSSSGRDERALTFSPASRWSTATRGTDKREFL